MSPTLWSWKTAKIWMMFPLDGLRMGHRTKNQRTKDQKEMRKSVGRDHKLLPPRMKQKRRLGLAWTRPSCQRGSNRRRAKATTVNRVSAKTEVDYGDGD